jgi:hypothetical protein
LQGFEVYRPGHPTGDETIVHLDPRAFVAVFPDRNRLRDEDQVVRRVDADIRKAAIAHLQEQKSLMPPAAFAATYFRAAEQLGAVHLFDTIDLLPRCAVQRFVDYPCDAFDTLNHEYLDIHEQDVSRASVEAGEVIIVEIDAVSTGDDASILAAMYARAQGWLVLDAALGEKHWLRQVDRDVAGAALDGRIELVPEQIIAEATFEGRWIVVRFVLCEHLSLRGPWGPVKLSEPIAIDEVIYWPTGGSEAKVLLQYSSYVDANDAFQDDAYEHDSEALLRFASGLEAADPAAALQAALNLSRLDQYPFLRGRTFSVSIDGDGRAAVHCVAESATESRSASRARRCRLGQRS